MLAAAAADPPPQAFEYAAAAFRFDRSPKGVQHTRRRRGSAGTPDVRGEPRARTYALRFTAMALVKDQTGQIVQRFSESYPLEGPLDRLPALKRGRLRFKRQMWLPPGRYTLWTIARDQATERSSVKSLPLDVRRAVQWHSAQRSFGHSNRGSRRATRSMPSRIRFGRVACGSCPTSICRSRRAQTRRFRHISRFIHDGGAGDPALTFEFMRDGAVIGRSAAELPEAGRHRPHQVSSHRFQRRRLRPATTSCAQSPPRAASPRARKPTSC